MRLVYSIFFIVILCSCSQSETEPEVYELKRYTYQIYLDRDNLGTVVVETRCHTKTSGECAYWEQNVCIADKSSVRKKCFERHLLENDTKPDFHAVDLRENRNPIINDSSAAVTIEKMTSIYLELSKFHASRESVWKEVELKCGFSDLLKKYKAERLLNAEILIYLPVLINAGMGQRYVISIDSIETFSLNLVQIYENNIRNIELAEDILHLAPLNGLDILEKFCRKAYNESPEGGFRSRYASSKLDDVYSHQFLQEAATFGYKEGSLQIITEESK